MRSKFGSLVLYWYKKKRLTRGYTKSEIKIWIMVYARHYSINEKANIYNSFRVNLKKKNCNHKIANFREKQIGNKKKANDFTLVIFAGSL